MSGDGRNWGTGPNLSRRRLPLSPLIFLLLMATVSITSPPFLFFFFPIHTEIGGDFPSSGLMWSFQVVSMDDDDEYAKLIRKMNPPRLEIHGSFFLQEFCLLVSC